MIKKEFISLYQVYKLSLEISQNYKNKFRNTLILFTFSFLFLGLSFAMFFPLLKSIFNDGDNLKNIILYTSLMAVFSVLSILFKWKAHNFDYSGNIIDITHNLRTKLGDKLRNMPLHSLSKYKTGELNSILSTDVDESILHMGIVSSIFLQIIIVPSVIVLFTFFIDFRLALIMLIVLPIMIPLYIKKRKNSIREKSELNQANSNLESNLIEYIQGIQVLRSVNEVGKNAKELQKSIKEVENIQKRDLKESILPLLLMGSIIETSLLIFVFLGSMWVEDSSLSAITLVALVFIVSRLVEPLTLFLGIVPVFDIMDASFQNIKMILNTESLKTIQPSQVPTNFDIEFKKVVYSYDKHQNILNDISFSLKENTLTAIVGHSGCGKTTIIKLLTRYDDIRKGSISIGNINIKNIEHNELMKNISIVFQDVYLFEDTILNNIKMAKPNAKEEEIIRASKLANCHNFIENLPHGYNTNIGDLGGNLSGGEKQRISIARAILKDAPILILDEPTASLDIRSELSVQKAINSLVKNRTVIIITHRLSTIMHADNILVLKDNKIVANGKHKKIINTCEVYKNIWKAQKRTKSWEQTNENTI